MEVSRSRAGVSRRGAAIEQILLSSVLCNLLALCMLLKTASIFKEGWKMQHHECSKCLASQSLTF